MIKRTFTPHITLRTDRNEFSAPDHRETEKWDIVMSRMIIEDQGEYDLNPEPGKVELKGFEIDGWAATEQYVKTETGSITGSLAYDDDRVLRTEVQRDLFATEEDREAGNRVSSQQLSYTADGDKEVYEYGAFDGSGARITLNQGSGLIIQEFGSWEAQFDGADARQTLAENPQTVGLPAPGSKERAALISEAARLVAEKRNS